MKKNKYRKLAKNNLRKLFKQKKVKKVLLVGSMGITGQAYLKLLQKCGYKVYAYDKKQNESQKSKIPFIFVTQKQFESGEILKSVDGVTLTPGVPLKLKIFQQAKKKQIPIFSEVEFCYPFLKKKYKIGITGTDGKSTTTHFIASLLGKRKAVACGNFGIPLSQISIEASDYPPILVIEFSSYQLELVRNWKLNQSLFLNIAPDHLNRYKSFNHYFKTKQKIAKLIKSKKYYLVSQQIKPSQKGIIINNNLKQAKHFFWDQNNILYYHSSKHKAKILCDIQDLNFGGAHNQTNLLFALESIFLYLGKREFVAKLKYIRESLLQLKGLPHRFEIFYQNNKVQFIDDSKATTSQAVVTAIKDLSSPTLLILGGQGKGEDFSTLAQQIYQKQIDVIVYGSEKDNLEKVLQKNQVSILANIEKLDDSIQVIQQFIENKVDKNKKITVILSPGMTSWDQYPSFAHRGEAFQEIILNLVKV